jgi:hypothetical protein
MDFHGLHEKASDAEAFNTTLLIKLLEGASFPNPVQDCLCTIILDFIATEQNQHCTFS